MKKEGRGNIYILINILQKIELFCFWSGVEQFLIKFV